MSEPGRTEQIISQFLLKTLHAVLAARIPHLHRPHPPRPRRRDRWFNLPLPDLPSSLDSVPSPSDPLIIDILLLSGGHETIIERWTAACDPAPTSDHHCSTYKKSIVLLRSLYSLIRLLPAYRAFRLLSGASHHSYNHDISYRVSSFAEPFSREEEAQLTPRTLASVDTQFGQLSVSVMYRPTLSEFSFEVSSLVPPTIIADYVGSPAAEPMKPFPASLPEKGMGSIPSSTSFPLRAAAPPALTRPHSWTSAPMAHRPLNRSPTMATVQQKGFDVYRLSPPLSTSPTPSPPAAYSGNPSRLRTETAPVFIPQQGKSLSFRSPNLSDPSRSPLPPLSPRWTRAADHSSQESPSESSRSFRKLEGLRVGDYYSNLHWYTTQKGALKDGRDDSGRFSGVLSSGGSPRFGISRSSSRLSIQDDLDDCDFSYPFAVDDVDTSDCQTRNIDKKQTSESAPTSTSSHKSQDAAVGVLVHMLKTAPPLRPDHSYSQSSNSELGEVGTSSFFLPRKASDALEELQSYRKMKEILLSQSGTQLLDSINHRGK